MTKFLTPPWLRSSAPQKKGLKNGFIGIFERNLLFLDNQLLLAIPVLQKSRKQFGDGMMSCGTPCSLEG